MDNATEKTRTELSLALLATAYLTDQIPVVDAPQVALAGRSNVGKSTLVNCLAGRKGLAKISATPGKTRSLNFYMAQAAGYCLVDLPGYGYARCSMAEREKWAKLIDAYLKKTSQLRAVTALVDCRLPPQRLDVELVDWLRSRHIPVLVVLTKADKCKQRDQEARKKEWRELARPAFPPILFSGKTGLGREALCRVLAEAALSPDPAPCVP
ncbi:ribosome biogenesis GTP-binding protein YihA/YsxC [Solidesulfovibrio sp. C21]|uniref:ribosome biogenesis GTP-binding protein YihA/YsxC n=1 Tax=Solidesulfovibrio sp. C21 TaxID=3398613 RepID=UPI0039FC8EF7